jgi:hypothetical protein
VTAISIRKRAQELIAKGNILLSPGPSWKCVNQARGRCWYCSACDNETLREVVSILKALASEEKPHPKGCECGGFDRTASLSSDKYVGYCKEQTK